MDLLFHDSGAPNEFPLDSIIDIKGSHRKLDVLHNVGSDATMKGFLQENSSSKVKKIYLPTLQLSIHIINGELEVIVARSGVEHL